MAKTIPTRKCVGCREEKPKNMLIRVIRTPEGEILPDPTGKANGRGAYICRSAECLRMAVKNKGLERSLKAQIPPEVLERIEKELL